MKTNTGTALQSSSIRVDNSEKRPQRLTILKHSQEPYFSDELQLGTNGKQQNHIAELLFALVKPVGSLLPLLFFLIDYKLE